VCTGTGHCFISEIDFEKFSAQAYLCFAPQGWRISISSTFYSKLLSRQIPKAQKLQSSHQCLFALLGPTPVKGACKMLVN
jgi:hypothetical protein